MLAGRFGQSRRRIEITPNSAETTSLCDPFRGRAVINHENRGSSAFRPRRPANGCEPYRVRRWSIFAAAAYGLLLFAGCRHDAKAEGAGDDETKPVLKVEVRPVVRTALDETVEMLGTTQPLKRRTARVTTAMEGRVAAILPEGEQTEVGDRKSEVGAGPPKGGTPTPASEFRPPTSKPAVEGQLVDQRQVIVRLDDSLARAAVARSQGALAEAQAAVSAQNVPRPQQLLAAEAAVASTKSAREAAEAQLKRLKDVEQLVGSSQIADAQTAIERARADEQSAAARLAELSDLPAAPRPRSCKRRSKRRRLTFRPPKSNAS